MPRIRTSQSPRAPSPIRPARRPRGLAANLRANLPGPADYVLFAALVIAARLWLHIAVPLAVAVVAGSVAVVIAVSVFGGVLTGRWDDSAGSGDG
jgi:hypothetical protein